MPLKTKSYHIRNPHLKTRGWPPARRRAQALRIRAAKPWRASTGPQSPEGKAISAQNAAKHGAFTARARALTLYFQLQRRFLNWLINLQQKGIGAKNQYIEIINEFFFYLKDVGNFLCQALTFDEKIFKWRIQKFELATKKINPV